MNQPVDRDSHENAGQQGVELTERELIINTLKQVVGPLAATLAHKTEVLVHDLSKLPNSIVAIHGDLTGRSVGDPATDLLLKQANDGTVETREGYRTRLPNGREMRSTTIAVQDSTGNAVAALCINSDIELWKELREFVSLVTDDQNAPTESFVRDVDELADVLLTDAIEAQGVPVTLMRKEHKVAVVRQVRNGGIFLIRDAAEIVATRLEVSRFTIYNYLNEIEKTEATPELGAGEPS